MNLLLDNRDLKVSNALKTFNLLDLKHLEMYQKNGFPKDLVIKFIDHELKGHQLQGVLSNLIGFEFNLYLLEYLKQIGAVDIQAEVDIGSTRLDALCKINDEYHTYEAKACHTLHRKCVQQIKKARGQYKNCHVFTLADTEIGKGIDKTLKDLGADIIIADIRYNDLKRKVTG